MTNNLVQGLSSPDEMLREGIIMANRSPLKGEGSENTKMRRFLEHFGAKPAIIASIWTRLHLKFDQNKMMKISKVFHILWSLLFMKTYATQSVLCSIAGGIDEKTFRK